MLSLEDINLQICKYRVDKMTISIPDMDTHNVNPMYISDFDISKEYDDYLYPYFNMRLAVPNQIFRAMRKNNTNITAYVRIVYSLFDTSEIANDSNRKCINFLAENFVVFSKDNTPSMTEEFSELVEKEAPESGDLGNSTSMEIMLIKKSAIALHDTIVNAIVTKTTLMNILAYLLTRGGASKVLCSPPDNKTVYDQFIIPPLRLDENIHHICNDYNFHKDGTMLFFDFDTTYIIAKNAKCTAWRTNEYKSTKIIYNPPINNAMISQGVYMDSKERVNYCTMAEATADTKSMVTDQVYGGNFKVIDNRTGEVKSAKSDAKYAQGSGKTNRTIIVNSGDSGVSDALVERVNEETVMMRVAISNVLLSMLTPNKEFELIFMSSKLSKYSGKYRLTSTYTIFRKTDGDWFTPSTYACFFGKIKK